MLVRSTCKNFHLSAFYVKLTTRRVPTDTRRRFNVVFWSKKDRDVYNVILTSNQRCFTNVASTSIIQRCSNVELTLILTPTLFWYRKSNVDPICIFNLFSTSNQRLGWHHFNVHSTWLCLLKPFCCSFINWSHRTYETQSCSSDFFSTCQGGVFEDCVTYH